MIACKFRRWAALAVLMAVLGFSQGVYAEIVYTAANTTVEGSGILKIDLNHDGTTDVSIVSSGGLGTFCQGHPLITAFGSVYALPATGNATVANGNLVLALGSGSKISSSSPFYSAEGLMLHYSTCTPQYNSGAWKNVANHYLGIRFLINGHAHFGWARLSVSETQLGPKTTLTGYAYESVAGASITAGQTTVVSSSLTLKVTSPLNDSTVTNPVPIAATATGPNPIAQIQVWVNYKEVFKVSGGTLNANVTLPVGSDERFVIQAVDSKANIAKVIYSITVK
jgi:hypothetical protein